METINIRLGWKIFGRPKPLIHNKIKYVSMLLAAAVTLGIGWGSAFPTLLTLAADRSSPDRVGRTMSMMSAAFAFGTAVGAVLVGSFADAFGFGLAYGIIAGLLVIALAVLLGDYRRTGRPLVARVETVG